jgi:hypothetical protein
MQDGQKEIFETIAKVSRFMPNFLNADDSLIAFTRKSLEIHQNEWEKFNELVSG